MPAPKYNQYWKERKKHGPNRIFNSEDEVLDKAQEYIEYCKNNPIFIEDFIKSGQQAGEKVYLERPRIPTQKGFTVFLGIDESTLYNYLNEDKNKDLFKCFKYVCEVFQSELSDNAITGQANPMIAARILGLKEKQDITSNGESISLNVSVKNPGLSNDLDQE